jgi:hypothetical protein
MFFGAGPHEPELLRLREPRTPLPMVSMRKVADPGGVFSTLPKVYFAAHAAPATWAGRCCRAILERRQPARVQVRD